jgi:hypothetical protein
MDKDEPGESVEHGPDAGLEKNSGAASQLITSDYTLHVHDVQGLT